MPTVPVISQQRVTPAPLPNARLNPSTQGAFNPAPVGPDLSGVAQVAAQEMQARQRIALEEKAKADQIATTHAYGALTVGTNDILHGENGVLNRRGKDAFTSDMDAQDRLGALQAEIRSQLGNDDQRAIFDKMVINEWSQIDNQVQSHIARERRIFDEQGTKALVEAKGDEALKSYENPDAVDAAIAVQKAATADYLRRIGASDETIQNATAETASSTRLGVLQMMLNSEKDLMATAYFKRYRAEFVGKDLQQAERLTQAGSVRGESQRWADAIVKANPSLSDAIAEAQKIEEPRVRDETEQRIRRHFSDVAADQRQDRERAYLTLSAKLERNGGNVDRLKASSEWLSLTPAEHNSLEHRALVIRHPDEGPGDREAELTLRNEAYFNPEEFATRNIMAEKGLNAKQKASLMGLQRTVGGREQREDAAIARRAEADARYYQRRMESAMASGDKDGAEFWKQRQVEAEGEAARVAPKPETPAAPAVQAEPKTSAPRTPQNPLGLAPITLTPPTPQMLEDIARKGPRYAEYLRSMGIDAPLTVVVPEAPKKKAKP